MAPKAAAALEDRDRLRGTIGGCRAGGLRSRWTDVHGVYFRDTADGFLAWAVSSLATAALLTTTIGSIVGSGVQAGASMAGGLASTAGSVIGGAAASYGAAQGRDGGRMGYFVDSLFRRGATVDPIAGSARSPTSAQSGERAFGRGTAEVGGICLHAGIAGPLPPEDMCHVGQIVAQRTDLSQQDADF